MKNEAKKVIIIGIFVIIGFLLQTSIFPFFSLSGVVPNIILLLVVSIAMINGSVSAMIVGFICGLLIDIMYGGLLGVYAFLYMFLGYINGYFHVVFFAQKGPLPLILVFINDFIYNLIIYFIFFLPQKKVHFLFYLKKNILPELIYTTVISIIMYQVFLKIYGLTKIKKKKRRG